MRTLLLGTIRRREAIGEAIQRRWQEVDPRFEVHDLEDIGKRQVIGTATFVVEAQGMEQRQTLTYLFTFSGEDEQMLEAIAVFRTPRKRGAQRAPRRMPASGRAIDG